MKKKMKHIDDQLVIEHMINRFSQGGLARFQGGLSPLKPISSYGPV